MKLIELEVLVKEGMDERASLFDYGWVNAYMEWRKSRNLNFGTEI